MSHYTPNSHRDSSKKGEVPLLLGFGSDRLMSYCPSLNIYRVNRFNLLTNDQPRRKAVSSPWITADTGGDSANKFDLIDELLMHNMIHVVEIIFEYVGFPDTWSCLRVNRLWYEFLAYHLFPRWAEQMTSQDASLHDIYDAEELAAINPGKLCWQVHQLRQVWQNQRPKLKRLSCDSFVLSIKMYKDSSLFCGLNNGTLQLWDLNRQGGEKKVHEQEVHDKGVKVAKNNITISPL
jgi:hypothetical protein